MVAAAIVAIVLVTHFHRESDLETAPAPGSAFHDSLPPPDAVEHAAAGTRTPVPLAGDPCVISVVDAANRPVQGCWAMGASEGDSWRDPASPHAIASTDEAGIIRLTPEQCPASRCVVLSARGHAPLLVDGIEPGASHTAVMLPSQSARCRVVAQDGSPVAGYRVALTRSDVRELPANGSGIADLVLRSDANGGAAAYGVSDSNGLIRFTNLVQAKYFVRVDAGDLPAVTTKAPVVVDVPCPDFDIQVSLLWAAAFRFVADHIVAHTSFTAGPNALLRGPASAQDYRTVQRWRRDLVKRFDGATVVVGLPTSKAMRGERAKVYSFGKMCGWQECEVPVVPIPKLENPTECGFRKLWHHPFRKLWHSSREEAPSSVTIS